jgi:hypothetical protein
MRGKVKTAVLWERLDRGEEDDHNFPGSATRRFNNKRTEAVRLSAELKFSEKLTKLQQGQLRPFEVGS